LPLAAITTPRPSRIVFAKKTKNAEKPFIGSQRTGEGPGDKPTLRPAKPRVRARSTDLAGAVGRTKPQRFSWIGRAGSICFRKSFVVRSLRGSYRPAPRSLLGLHKHLLRHHFPPN
jgi:hypothetical protein